MMQNVAPNHRANNVIVLERQTPDSCWTLHIRTVWCRLFEWWKGYWFFPLLSVNCSAFLRAKAATAFSVS